MVRRGAQPECDLWRFSVEFYRRRGVAGALIALQDREGLDVNLMLFALWLGISGRDRLDRDGLKVADCAIHQVRTEIIEPLRTLRRRLKLVMDEDVQSLREQVQALEIAAEKVAQTRLAAIAGPAEGDLSAEIRLAAARANFALYIGPEEDGDGEAAVIRDALEAFARAD